jgi:hypothetical protein
VVPGGENAVCLGGSGSLDSVRRRLGEAIGEAGSFQRNDNPEVNHERRVCGD